MRVVQRRFWQNRIAESRLRHSIVSVVGVRGAGKTSVARLAAQGLSEADLAWPDGRPQFLDCAESGTRDLLSRPEAFLGTLTGRTIILDEVGRLANAADLLELAASRYPDATDGVPFRSRRKCANSPSA